MKFEYDGVNECGKFVAFIDSDGDLCVKVGEGSVYFTCDGGFIQEVSDFEAFAESNGVKKKFYPGDKITITF